MMNLSSAPRRRLMLQYLEPGPLVDATPPERLRDHLRLAMEVLEPTDLALGWRLRPEQIEAVCPLIPNDVDLWRWVPMLVHAGAEWANERQLQVGPCGRAPEPFKGMDDFRFLCPSDSDVVRSSIDRAVALAREIDGDGVLLDRIRWHSPSQEPASELTCFCERCSESASAEGLDLGAVERDVSEAARSGVGRSAVVQALLGVQSDGVLADFLEWRRRHVSATVTGLSDAIRQAGLRTALDVFTPALAASVGQDLEAIAPAGEWTKAMTYFDAVGPATLPYELRGYMRWLEAIGVKDPARMLADALQFEPPGVTDSGPRLGALAVELERLTKAVGRDAAVMGIDAVELAGVCEVKDEDLDSRLVALRSSGVGVSPSWELLAISPERMRRIASTL